jgi:DNA modification methylase
VTVTILQGDCRDVLATLPSESVNCIVTSPPYFGLRSYLPDGHPDKTREIGLERTSDQFVGALVSVFREARRVLRHDGTLWLNLGDSYAGSWRAQGRGGPPSDKPALKGNGHTGGGSKIKSLSAVQIAVHPHQASGAGSLNRTPGLKAKDLIGIPWRVAFALQADGWYLRQALPWVKRNPMPESTRDRPTTAVEHVFMLTKSARYYYDYDGLKRTMAPSSEARLAQNVEAQAGSLRANAGGKTNGAMKAVRGDKQRGHSRRHAGFNERWDKMEREEQRGERAFRNSDLFFDSLSAPHGAIMADGELIALDVATQPYRDAHFAVMPARLCEPLILASCPIGGVVLDPFGGAGTTGLVADRMQRNAILIDLNGEYADMQRRRVTAEAPLLTGVA